MYTGTACGLHGASITELIVMALRLGVMLLLLHPRTLGIV